MTMLSPFSFGGPLKRPLRDTILGLWAVIAFSLLYVAYSRYGDDLPERISSHITTISTYACGSNTYPLDNSTPSYNEAADDSSGQESLSGYGGLSKWVGQGQKVQDVPEGPLIPKKIWQNMFSHLINPDELKETPSWLALNPDYAYKLVGMPGADQILEKYYSDRDDVVTTFHKLRNTGLRSDLLRYMLLFNEGGVYTDIDTVALKPIDKWVPEKYRDQVRVLVGLEFDQLDGVGWVDIPHELQFCQWTIAAAPGHRVMAKMLDHGIRRLQEVVREHNTTLEDLKPTSMDVLTSTGPAAWTDVVFTELQAIEPELTTLRNLSGMTGPRIFGDIMILPIDAFGVGQPHSNSTNDGTIPKAALAKHLFRGSWRGSNHVPDDDSDEDIEDNVENSKGEKISNDPSTESAEEDEKPGEAKEGVEKPNEKPKNEEKPEKEEKPKQEGKPKAPEVQNRRQMRRSR